MSNYNKRQELIIASLLTSDMSTGALLESLATWSIEVSEDSLVRDITGLKDIELVESLGKGPARKHLVTSVGNDLSHILHTAI